MDTTRFEASISRWNLLNHPFYQAWNQGTLPMSDLQTYAREYGAFIASIPQGWTTLGDTKHAAEEVEHAELWQQFAQGLDTRVTGANEVTEMATLVDRATALFGDRATAIGALYAFEAQQPRTSATKLVGLEAHYSLPAGAEQYFVTHADEYGEAEILQRAFDALEPSEQDVAAQACEEVCECLWDALSGVYSGDC